MSTRPLLLYYGIMSLALAELLMKGTGAQSLDYARGQHAHHGLDFRPSAIPSKIHALADSAAALRAVPLIKDNGQRFGTFELWHQVARETPQCGKIDHRLIGGGHQESTDAVFGSEDVRYPPIPSSGITLLQCFQSLYQLRSILSLHNVERTSFRATANAIIDEKNSAFTYTMVIQPNMGADLSACYDKITFEPSAINKLEIQEFPSGCLIRWTATEKDHLRLHFPNGFQEYESEFYLQSDITYLNEFGVLYAGMFMLGNYARYFPEQWMADVEAASPLAIAARLFTDLAEERAPLLALSELSRRWHLRD